MIRYQSQNRAQSSNSQILVGWNGNSLVAWYFSLNNDVTSGLVNFPIRPVTAETVRQARAR
jgi:hypothetical protein